MKPTKQELCKLKQKAIEWNSRKEVVDIRNGLMGFIAGLIISSLIFYTVGAIAVYFANIPEPTCQEYKVIRVGGCDRNGLCGVTTEAGYKTTYYPVEGQKIKICQ